MKEICRWRKDEVFEDEEHMEFRVVYENNGMLFGVFYTTMLSNGWLGSFMFQGECHGEIARCSCKGEPATQSPVQHDVPRSFGEEIWEDVQRYLTIALL
jgi:hypothetical protein